MLRCALCVCVFLSRVYVAFAERSHRQPAQLGKPHCDPKDQASVTPLTVYLYVTNKFTAVDVLRRSTGIQMFPTTAEYVHHVRFSPARIGRGTYPAVCEIQAHAQPY